MDRRDAALRPPDQSEAERAPGPGPRQEYLDAFDDDGFGHLVPEPRRGAPAELPSARRRHVRTTEPKPALVPAQTRRRHAGGGRGRTLTGVAAAAVLTVLAVAVPVRVLGGPDGEVRERADAVEDAGGEQVLGAPAGTPSEPVPRTPAEPASYEEELGTPFELDPELAGSGELVPVGGGDPSADPRAASQLRYRVDVEAGFGLDAEFFAEAVHRTLNDERGWGGGERSFTRVSGDDYDFVVTLASPGTTAEWCARSGLDITEDNVSCNSSSTERVMINAWRWAQGSDTYGDDIAGYRQMLVNHEVGHRLGFPHVDCPGEGDPAPVMMQQTKFLETDGVTCRPNPWPHPGN